MKRFTLALVALLVSGCLSTTEIVHLKNSQTGQVIQCGPYDLYDISKGGKIANAAREDLRYCVNDYQSQGFVRVPKP